MGGKKKNTKKEDCEMKDPLPGRFRPSTTQAKKETKLQHRSASVLQNKIR